MNQTLKIKNHIMLKRIIFIAVLLTTFFIIFNFSAQDGNTSGSISEKVTKFVVNIISKISNINEETQNNIIKKMHPIIRKLAHFSIYTVVGFSIMGVMCTFNVENKLKIGTSLIVGVIYAISDEIHQYYIPGRACRLFDVGIDSLGVIAGICILVGCICISNKALPIYFSIFTKNKKYEIINQENGIIIKNKKEVNKWKVK